MAQDIFVGILCMIALAAGVWCWRMENVRFFHNRKEENTGTELIMAEKTESEIKCEMKQESEEKENEKNEGDLYDRTGL